MLMTLLPIMSLKENIMRHLIMDWEEQLSVVLLRGQLVQLLVQEQASIQVM